MQLFRKNMKNGLTQLDKIRKMHKKTNRKMFVQNHNKY